MSNYDLQSEVNSLRSQLATIERENNELRSEIGVAVGAVVAAENALVETNNQINTTLTNANYNSKWTLRTGG